MKLKQGYLHILFFTDFRIQSNLLITKQLLGTIKITLQNLCIPPKNENYISVQWIYLIHLVLSTSSSQKIVMKGFS